MRELALGQADDVTLYHNPASHSPTRWGALRCVDMTTHPQPAQKPYVAQYLSQTHPPAYPALRRYTLSYIYTAKRMYLVIGPSTESTHIKRDSPPSRSAVDSGLKPSVHHVCGESLQSYVLVPSSARYRGQPPVIMPPNGESHPWYLFQNRPPFDVSLLSPSYELSAYTEE